MSTQRTFRNLCVLFLLWAFGTAAIPCFGGQMLAKSVASRVSVASFLCFQLLLPKSSRFIQCRARIFSRVVPQISYRLWTPNPLIRLYWGRGEGNGRNLNEKKMAWKKVCVTKNSVSLQTNWFFLNLASLYGKGPLDQKLSTRNVKLEDSNQNVHSKL